MEQKFVCNKCGNPQSVETLVIGKKGFALAHLLCKKSHADKLKLEISQQSEWESAIIDRIYKCSKCGLNLEDMDRIALGKKTVLVLSCPTHGKIQKALSTSFWHYSIESKRTSKAVTKLMCNKCGFPQSIEVLVVGKKGYEDYALAELTCKDGHVVKRKFELSSQDDWLSSVINCIYTCPKCGLDLVDLDQKMKDNKTILFLNCSVHGKIKKTISTPFWHSIEVFKNQLMPSPEIELVVDAEPQDASIPTKIVQTPSTTSKSGSTVNCPDCNALIQSVRCLDCVELTDDIRKCQHCGGEFSYLICRVCRMEIPLNEESIWCPECGKLIKNVRCSDCGELNYNVRGCDHCGGEFSQVICGDCGTRI